tara:strand:- start:325 stop:618 length:294 start_codon:yes stop_codon:yes gene_type:complete
MLARLESTPRAPWISERADGAKIDGKSRKLIGGGLIIMDKIISFAYAATMAVSQALVTFSQIRADQQTIEKMSDTQIQALLNPKTDKPAIGFNRVRE